MKKSYREKLAAERAKPSRVERLSGKMEARFGSGTLLIPSVVEVEELMRKVRKGTVTTTAEIRETLAERHGATMCCAIVTGIHARVLACVAGEEEAEGKTRVLPYWRTLKAGGKLNEKYPGGVEEQRRRLQAEGFGNAEKLKG